MIGRGIAGELHARTSIAMHVIVRLSFGGKREVAVGTSHPSRVTLEAWVMILPTLRQVACDALPAIPRAIL